MIVGWILYMHLTDQLLLRNLLHVRGDSVTLEGFLVELLSLLRVYGYGPEEHHLVLDPNWDHHQVEASVHAR